MKPVSQPCAEALVEHPSVVLVGLEPTTPLDDSSSVQEPFLHLDRRPEDDRIDHVPVVSARLVATGLAVRGTLVAVSRWHRHAST